MQDTKTLIEKRAYYKKKVRQCFEKHHLTEVDVPSIGDEACPDTSSKPVSLRFNSQELFLQPSPEYFIKRLLSHSPGSYYSLAPCFRDDPLTARHNPEFLMCEYYLLGDSYERIKELTVELITNFLPQLPVETISYLDAFERTTKIQANGSLRCYQRCLEQHHIDYKQDWSAVELEDLLFATLCQPTLGLGKITFIDAFPFHHRALSEFDSAANYAHRFEVFINGYEIANGYKECTDPEKVLEQVKNWENQWLYQQNPVPTSNKFLQAKCPQCSGVALGFDRLVQLALGAPTLQDILLFPWKEKQGRFSI